MSEPSGPRDLGALSGILTGVSFLGGVGGATALADAPFPRPGATGADIRHYFESSASAARLSAAGQIVSALALARFTVSVARLAARSGPGSRALQTVAVAGGGLAVASLVAGWLIPGGRFPGLVVSGIAGARLASRHPTAPTLRQAGITGTDAPAEAHRCFPEAHVVGPRIPADPVPAGPPSIEESPCD